MERSLLPDLLLNLCSPRKTGVHTVRRHTVRPTLNCRDLRQTLQAMHRRRVGHAPFRPAEPMDATHIHNAPPLFLVHVGEGGPSQQKWGRQHGVDNPIPVRWFVILNMGNHLRPCTVDQNIAI